MLGLPWISRVDKFVINEGFTEMRNLAIPESTIDNTPPCKETEGSGLSSPFSEVTTLIPEVDSDVTVWLYASQTSTNTGNGSPAYAGCELSGLLVTCNFLEDEAMQGPYLAVLLGPHIELDEMERARLLELELATASKAKTGSVSPCQ